MEWAASRVMNLLSVGVSKEGLVKELLGDHDGLNEGWRDPGGLEIKVHFSQGTPKTSSQYSKGS